MNMDKNIEPYNDKGQRHGVWEMYWGNGRLWFKCFYYNSKRVGYEELYHYHNGKMKDKTYYL